MSEPMTIFGRPVVVPGLTDDEVRILFGDPDEPGAPVGILSDAARRTLAAPRICKVPLRPRWDRRTR